MRQIKLTSRDDGSITILQWDEKTGELSGNEELVTNIKSESAWAIKQGYWALIPTWNYPINNPLHDALELAVILSSLGFYSDDLPLPQDDTDPNVYDEHGNVIGYLVF